MSLTAAIFDLDGTLIDSTPDIAGAIGRAFSARGYDAPDEPVVGRMIGNGAHRLVADLLRYQHQPAGRDQVDALTADYLACYAERPVARTTMFPHVAEDLSTLRRAGLRLGLCTNKPHALTLAILDGLGLGDLFDGVLGADVVPARKPDPGHLLAVAELIGCDRNWVYVGDTEVDEATAIAAGVPFRAVAWAAPGRLGTLQNHPLHRLTDLLGQEVDSRQL